MLNVFGCDFDGLTGDVCSIRCEIQHPRAQLPAVGSSIRYPSNGRVYRVEAIRKDPFPPGPGMFVLWDVVKSDE